MMPAHAPIENKFDLIYRLAREWGIFAAMTCALFWLAYQEHQHQRQVLDEAQTYIRTTLYAMVQTTADSRHELQRTISKNTETIDALREVVEQAGRSQPNQPRSNPND